MRGSIAQLVLVGSLAVSLATCKTKPQEEKAQAQKQGTAVKQPRELRARAQLADKSGRNVGIVTLVQKDDRVTIKAEVKGLSPGPHAIHIHENGECVAPNFESAGGHFNPERTKHGAPTDKEHHAGDLGNLVVDQDGTATYTIVSDDISLSAGDHAVTDRAMVIHEKADDFHTQPVGAAGARIVCGVIHLSQTPSIGRR